jgi:hypothetical protein
VFETSHSAKASVPASAVWARWANPSRWPEWDKRVQSAEADSELAEGSGVQVKLRKGGRLRHRVTVLEPGRRLVTEYPLPGARVGHEHVVEQRGPIAEVSHRLYVDGPLAGPWSVMLGRRKLRETVAAFTDAES